MGSASLPPGFRFHPTDEELIGYYLKRKVEGLQIELEVIPVVKLYKFDPWELPEKSFLPKDDMEWFFFCPRDRKYPNGSRTNRATISGYWKATGKDRKVLSQSSVLGYRKTLVFYRGRAPFGNRTDWIMHEYRLCDEITHGTPSFQGLFALCRVMKKKEQKTSYVNRESKTKGIGASSKNTKESNFPISPNDFHNFCVSPALILDSSKEQSEEQKGQFGYFHENKFPKPLQHDEQLGISPTSSYSNFTEEDDLTRFGFNLGDESLTGLFGNEDNHISYDWTNIFT